MNDTTLSYIIAVLVTIAFCGGLYLGLNENITFIKSPNRLEPNLEIIVNNGISDTAWIYKEHTND